MRIVKDASININRSEGRAVRHETFHKPRVKFTVSPRKISGVTQFKHVGMKRGRAGHVIIKLTMIECDMLSPGVAGPPSAQYVDDVDASVHRAVCERDVLDA